MLRPPRERRRHREMLWVCAVGLAMALLLQVRPDGRVVFPGLTNHPLPESCASQRLFNAKCPGCGMTRSFIQLAHLRFQESWNFHRLGWLLFAAMLLQFPYRLAALYRERPPLAGSKAPRMFTWTLLALLLGNWLVGFVI